MKMRPVVSGTRGEPTGMSVSTCPHCFVAFACLSQPLFFSRHYLGVIWDRIQRSKGHWVSVVQDKLVRSENLCDKKSVSIFCDHGARSDCDRGNKMTGLSLAQIKSAFPLQYLTRFIRGFELVLPWPSGSNACDISSSNERKRQEKRNILWI